MTTRNANTTKLSAKLLALLMALAIATLLGAAGCASGGQNDNQAGSEATTQTDNAEDISVDVTIKSTVADHEMDETKTVEIPADGTAYDALMATGADVSSESGFVDGIDGLENGAAGSVSGWTFMVNGEQPTVGADQFKLKAGDKVEWSFYTGE